MRDRPFIHLTQRIAGADSVRAGLDLLGRREEVFCSFDDLAVGPLHDVDRDAAARVAWWRRVVGRTFKHSRSQPLDEAPIWTRIVDDGRDVVVWHGPHPAEYMHALRACWWLRLTPSRVFEVRLPAADNPTLAPFYGSVAGSRPERIAAAWSHVRRVRRGTVENRAKQWFALRRQRGDRFRELRRGRIIELPVTVHDEALMRAAKAWSSPFRGVGRVIDRHPTGDYVLFWRTRELLAAGRLEGRGRGRLGLPKEVRAAEAD